MSLNLNSSNLTSTYPHEWQMGATSSCINDIGNDDFVPIVNIEEVSDEERETSTNEDVTNYTKLSVPAIHQSVSDHSISNILDLFETNNDNTENSFLTVPATINSTELKSSGSDISISFFLDSEQNSDIYDENSFASVNSNSSHRKKSNSNVSFTLDE